MCVFQLQIHAVALVIIRFNILTFRESTYYLQHLQIGLFVACKKSFWKKKMLNQNNGGMFKYIVCNIDKNTDPLLSSSITTKWTA